ncbi:transmembrane protein 131 isoform X1 [Xenopus laevis]|uniref:Transmembrane protein 131 isoform X1 n=1 Tax=Xenopus laevis TaxID=8355 RepID=A0A8J1MGE8_XENLA|nr:transmembrane protein 131 isoform X1 [Xenopus laevis]
MSAGLTGIEAPFAPRLKENRDSRGVALSCAYASFLTSSLAASHNMARIRPVSLLCCSCCSSHGHNNYSQDSSSRRIPCNGIYSLLIALLTLHPARTHTEAFIQSENVIEVLRFDDGGLLEAETTIGLHSYQQKSMSLHRGNCRPIRFEPPMLDFHEQPVGMPKMEKVYLHNPSSEETITLISISATTSHFHASFFQNRKILPGGNTSFDVVFLARVVGNVENTLFINTSNHGVFTYQVFGIGIPNPYRLRPFIGARVPVNSSFSPLINIHNPHSKPLQVVEMYSSGGDLHLELPTGQQGGTRKLWEIPPYETKGVMRASFSSREADNHTAFIRIKTNASDSTEFIILPLEVEVTTAPGIYSSTEMLDFGTLRTQDAPKVLNLHLLNSGMKDVPITSVRSTPQNDAVTVHFKPITLKASESKYTKVASISFDASKSKKPSQFSGKITVKAKEKSYSKLEIPYQAEVLDGYLGFDHAATLFHIRDSPSDPVDRAIFLTNTFNFAILIHDVLLPEDAKPMFKIQNFSSHVLIPAGESRYIFSLLFTPSTSSVHIDSNILLITNASKFHLPLRAYTGFLNYFVLPPKLKERFLDFGILSALESSSLLIAIMNSNPIELAIKNWHVIGESLSIDLLTTEKGNRTSIIASLPEFENATVSDRTSVILTSGFYAVFRVSLIAKDLEGSYDGGIQVTTDYEILTVPVKAVVAVGSLTCSPKRITLPPSFPGKVVHQSLNIMSSFSQKVKIQHIRSLSEDVRFFYKKLRSNKDELEPGKKSKIAHIYFDAALNCGDHCYVGLPFLLKSESKGQHLAMQEYMWDSDWDNYENLYKKWSEIRENADNLLEVAFEVDADLQKNILSDVKAELMWPSIVSSARYIRFPLTNTNSSTVEEVLLENPSDAPVYIQILPLALYSNNLFLLERIIDRFNISKSFDIDMKTLEFQVCKNNVKPVQSSHSFVEGSSHHSVLNLVLKSGDKQNVKLKFTPVQNQTVSSLLIVRNNLTVIDVIIVEGQGAKENLKVAGKAPGPGSSLRFKITEAFLKDCTDKVKHREPNFTMKRTFKIENTGQLDVIVKSMEISGYSCEGYGFKILNCNELLGPNASKEVTILFTPDFTSSRVIRELRIVTAGGSEFVFELNASLPYHMLATCAEALPRPNWELALYVIISGIMSLLFLLVIVTAYLEAQGIWEPFKRRLSFESTHPSIVFGRPFDLRRIVGISSESSFNSLGSDSNHSSNRGLYTGSTSSKTGAGNQKPCNPVSNLQNSRSAPDTEISRTKNNSNISSKLSSQASVAQPGSRAPYVQIDSNTAAQNQALTKRFRGTRANQTQVSQDQLPSTQSPSVPPPQAEQRAEISRLVTSNSSHPEYFQAGSNNYRHSSDDSDISNLIEAMDRDFDQSEVTHSDVFTEQTPSSALKNKAGKTKSVQHKFKFQKKQEEKDRRIKGKQPEDEFKDSLADDDSSSTTTETSNPDAEPPVKEDGEKLKGKQAMPVKTEKEIFNVKPKSRKALNNNKKENVTEVKQSSLELPYTTPLENKQMKNFSKISVQNPLLNGFKPKTLQKGRGTNNKLVDNRQSLAKFLPCRTGQELGNTSSSEGEKDSPPPEWDSVPIHKAGSAADSLYKLSLQTHYADDFLKQRQTSPAPTSPSPPPSANFVARGSYSSIVNSAHNLDLRSKVTGSKHKLTKAASLPGQNGNPTFAAVAAGYDKNPGGNGVAKPAIAKSEAPSNICVSHTISLDSNGSDSSGLWSPISSPNSPDLVPLKSFSAFGPSNSFNLTGEVFNKLTFPRSAYGPDPQKKWREFESTSSIWDAPSTDPIPTWPTSTGSPTHTSPAILGNTSSLWPTSNPFSNSIWSSNPSSLPYTTNTLPPIDLMTSESACSSSNATSAAASHNPDTIGGQTYDPWRIWSPTIGRRSSNPWPNTHYQPDN